jgi:hypothetical protein
MPELRPGRAQKALKGFEGPHSDLFVCGAL